MLLHAWMFAAAMRLTSDARLMRDFSDLVVRAQLRSGTEAAAFVVRTADDRYVCIPWPATNMVGEQQFRGAIPANLVAIVHTHPEYSDPQPSEGDIREAQRLHVAIYVLTHFSIYVTDSAGRIERVIGRSDWVSAARAN